MMGRSGLGRRLYSAILRTGFLLVVCAPMISCSGSYLPITVGATNVPFASVTVCAPGGNQCAKVNNVIVDTGSTGLRIFSGALGSVTLPPLESNGGSLAECVTLGSGPLWGSVSTASVTMAGEPAVNVPIQIIDPSFGSSPSPPWSPPSPCNAGLLDSSALGGGNGLLGIAPFQSDTGVPNSVSYFTCQIGSCTAQNIPPQTVQNPVYLLPTDNNGVFVTMGQIPLGGAAAAGGKVVFGIGTNWSNDPWYLTSGYPYSTVAGSSFQFGTTLYDPPFEPGNVYGTPFASSLIDTGSNFLFFDDGTIPQCAPPCIGITCIFNPPGPVYCPAAPCLFPGLFGCAQLFPGPYYEGLFATVGPCGNSSQCPQTPVNFQTGNGNTLLNSGNIAFNDLAAPYPITSSTPPFDWGMPFFYGKSVFIAYGSTSFGNAPMWGFAPIDLYNQVVVQIATGNDDLRDDSEAVATFSGQSAPICLKASDAGTDNWGPNGNPGCPQDSSAQGWPDNSVDQVVNNPFSLNPPVQVFGTMSITLIQHPRGWEGWDNWDLAGITVTALDQSGNPTVILSLGSLFANSGDCVARLKNGPGIDTVTFQLMTPTVGGTFGPEETIGAVASGNTNCND